MLCPVLRSVLVCKDSFSCSASEQGEAWLGYHSVWERLGVTAAAISMAEGEASGGKALPWVLLVSSSRHPDRWIVPGGGMEPEEEPGVAAVREVCEEAGVKGTLGRLVGIFENRDRKHRTYVYVLIVTEVLEDWEDSVNIGRKREWFKIEDAIKVLQYHKPVQASYFETLRQGCLANNGTPVMSTPYSEGSVSDIR
uniref:diphosphoinositol-polyphosphate diphosphatase n=1 Tax=Zonotrichia albicollis TaxID=44394 RepID=A0A8D2QFC4_ZONAL